MQKVMVKINEIEKNKFNYKFENKIDEVNNYFNGNEENDKVTYECHESLNIIKS